MQFRLNNMLNHQYGLYFNTNTSGIGIKICQSACSHFTYIQLCLQNAYNSGQGKVIVNIKTIGTNRNAPSKS